MIDSLSLNTLTPPNLLQDKTIADIIKSLDPHLKLLASDIQEAEILSRINALSENALDYLAFQFHADFYDIAETLPMKRSSVSSSLSWHMKKGTPSAIIAALDALGITAEFIPWWKFGGAPYTFRIKAEITGDFYRGAGQGKITRLITRAVNEAKSARSFMAALETSLNFSENISITAGIIRVLDGWQVLRPKIPDEPSTGNLYAGFATHHHGNLFIPVQHVRTLEGSMTYGLVGLENWNSNIGIEDGIMQDLLIQFERRIFARIDQMQNDLTAKFDTRYKELETKADSVLDMLRWKGPDDPL